MTLLRKAELIISALTRYVGANNDYKTPRQLYNRMSANAIDIMYTMVCRQHTIPSAMMESRMQSIEEQIVLSGYIPSKYRYDS